MALQSQVFTSAAPGVPGMKASLNPFVYHPNTLLSEGDEVAVGSFVWLGTEPELQAVNSTAGSGKPLGLVERNIIYPNYDVTSTGGMILPEGSALAIGIRGDYWAETSTAATVGQKVFASTTDGSVATGAAGATVAGHVETDWVVETAGAAGELIIISNH